MGRKKLYKKPEPRCEHFLKRVNHESYSGICCKNRSYVIGFSTNPEAFYLTQFTFNQFVVPSNHKEHRDRYMKNFCRGKYIDCEFYSVKNKKDKP